jgi:hypothetical protein
MTRMAVLSANVAMVVVGEVGRSAVYRRYSSSPRTLPWGPSAWIGDGVELRDNGDRKIPVVQI